MAKKKAKKQIKFYESWQGTMIGDGMMREAKRLQRIYDKRVRKSKKEKPC